MTPEEQKQLQSLVAESFTGPFKPFAVFDESLDCIRVMWRDCSAKAIRAGELLTILVENYPMGGRPECVGFTIKGVAHICQTAGIPSETPWKLAQFLDALLTLEKPHGRFTLQQSIEPLVRARGLENQEIEREKKAA